MIYCKLEREGTNAKNQAQGVKHTILVEGFSTHEQFTADAIIYITNSKCTWDPKTRHNVTPDKTTACYNFCF